MVKGMGAQAQTEQATAFVARVKRIQRGLFFRSWCVDRPVQILSSVEPDVERSLRALAASDSSSEGAVGIALDLPNAESFFRLIATVDVRFGALVLGGEIDVAALLTTFPHRRVRGLKHARSYPFGLEPGEDDEAEVAVVGELAMPAWPRLGLAMPVLENAKGARRTALTLLGTYPGALDLAIVANGSSEETLNRLLALEGEACEHVSVTRERQNLGFPGGVNLGLQELWTSGWYDLFGVVHDDVTPSLNAMTEMVEAFESLRNLGQRPGVLGPTTNRAEGTQRVALNPYATLEEFEEQALGRFSEYRRSADEVERVGSHLMLIDSETLSDVGGFDPSFGRGFFSDDDWCLRARLAGYRVWLAQGAYVHHDGGTTFAQLRADEVSTVERNQALFLEKWRTDEPQLQQALYMPLLRALPESGHEATIEGEQVDLVHQASPVEFATFVSERLSNLPREARMKVLDALRPDAYEEESR
jgi:GT2 family glycosyltransferase